MDVQEFGVNEEKSGDTGSVPQTFTQPPINKGGKYLCVTGQSNFLFVIMWPQTKAVRNCPAVTALW